MSLNWDVSKIEDKDFLWLEASALYEKPYPRGIVEGEKYLNPKVESIIFACMTVDMSGPTKTNKVEFYLRYLLWCRLNKYDPYFTFSDVEKVVGLTTNVFERSTTQWRKWAFDTVAERLTKQINDGEYREAHEND
jgi:hypothetical protein